uniref:uncharacterized protein LOC108594017 n=1 Tax=Callithrix jacchus TaxID=9483 RepID=UPI0023DD26DD|nr:uncharacterized protein LOC108594017 [Callithrix jacchus]XP_054098439.1 uncharacterized protein LOC108594017 [Callithrix jacchus]XP_054098440.1 uncharacterized protein LOC108594017 [Callithrix jacchus]XP_054098441.1 uncharacterized protein LOC108594017 [Callithrix jacchus]
MWKPHPSCRQAGDPHCFTHCRLCSRHRGDQPSSPRPPPGNVCPNTGQPGVSCPRPFLASLPSRATCSSCSALPGRTLSKGLEPTGALFVAMETNTSRAQPPDRKGQLRRHSVFQVLLPLAAASAQNLWPPSQRQKQRWNRSPRQLRTGPCAWYCAGTPVRPEVSPTREAHDRRGSSPLSSPGSSMPNHPHAAGMLTRPRREPHLGLAEPLPTGGAAGGFAVAGSPSCPFPAVFQQTSCALPEVEGGSRNFRWTPRGCPTDFPCDRAGFHSVCGPGASSQPGLRQWKMVRAFPVSDTALLHPAPGLSQKKCSINVQSMSKITRT